MSKIEIQQIMLDPIEKIKYSLKFVINELNLSDINFDVKDMGKYFLVVIEQHRYKLSTSDVLLEDGDNLYYGNLKDFLLKTFKSKEKI